MMNDRPIQIENLSHNQESITEIISSMSESQQENIRKASKARNWQMIETFFFSPESEKDNNIINLRKQLLDFQDRAPKNSSQYRIFLDEEAKGSDEIKAIMEMSGYIKNVSQERSDWPETKALEPLGYKKRKAKAAADRVLKQAVKIEPELLSKLLSGNDKLISRYLFPGGSLKRQLPLEQLHIIAMFRDQLTVFGEAAKELNFSPKDWSALFNYMHEATALNLFNPYRLKHGIFTVAQAGKINRLSFEVREHWKTQLRKVVTGALITGAIGGTWLLARNRFGERELPLESTPRVTEVSPTSSAAPLPSLTSLTPTLEPAPTKDPEKVLEKALAVKWKGLRTEHEYMGISGQVVDETMVKEPDVFFQKLENLIRENNLMKEDGTISYNSGQSSEIYLWTEQEGTAVRIKYDGRYTSPAYTAKTVYFDQQEGVCAAVADEPLSDGSWQQNEVRFDTETPKTCFFIAGTMSSRIVLIMIVPSLDGPQVYSTIVNDN